MGVWILCVVLSLVVMILIIKLRLMKKSMTEIHTQIDTCLSEDTNALITVTSNDKDIKYLAMKLNEELRMLRSQSLKYKNGDNELKEAVTNIAHDLRTPLTALCGYLELLEEKEKTEDVARYIELIRNRADNLKGLTEELFRYSVIISTLDDINLEPLSVNRVLEECIAKSYDSLTERGITPRIDITTNKIIRTLDKAALIRVIENIISNAIKYSDGDLDIELTDSGEMIFTNTARRLDDIQVGKLFNRFFTVETAGKGTGLGLSVAKTLVEQMNGKIAAEYVEGRLSICISYH